jgi:hypothetical protein
MRFAPEKAFPLFSNGVNYKTQSEGVVKKCCLRSTVRSAKKYTKIRVTVVPPYNHKAVS